ncbi:unnamed protein product [Gadus morhua 'NCC']
MSLDSGGAASLSKRNSCSSSSKAFGSLATSSFTCYSSSSKAFGSLATSSFTCYSSSSKAFGSLATSSFTCYSSVSPLTGCSDAPLLLSLRDLSSFSKQPASPTTSRRTHSPISWMGGSRLRYVPGWVLRPRCQAARLVVKVQDTNRTVQ